MCSDWRKSAVLQWSLVRGSTSDLWCLEGESAIDSSDASYVFFDCFEEESDMKAALDSEFESAARALLDFLQRRDEGLDDNGISETGGACPNRMMPLLS